MTNTPAGWYPDSERPGQQRYWDGTAWTEHRAPGAPSAPTPVGGGGINGAPDDRPWFKKKRFIIPIVLVVLMVIGGIAGESESPSSTDSTSASDENSADEPAEQPADEPVAEPAEEPAKEAPQEATVSATAADMIKEFEDNELQADAKYKDKWVEVSGVVDKIDTEMFNSKKYVLNIGTGSDWDILTVNCHGMPKSELASLTKGNAVKIIGEFDDGGDLGVEINKCRLS